MSILGISSQYGSLIQLFPTILNPMMHLDSNLDSSLLQVRMCSHSHGLSSSYLTSWSYKFLVLLILGHGLVYVSLHELVLLI